MEIITTERLIIRQFRETDAEDVYELRSDPEVNRFMPYPCDADISETRLRIGEWMEKKYRMAIELRESGKVIGDISLSPRDGDKLVELGYNLNRSFWGKGYATEAARAVIQQAVSEGIRDFMAYYAKENGASGRVLEKCGFVPEYTGQYSRDNGKEVFEAVISELHIK